MHSYDSFLKSEVASALAYAIHDVGSASLQINKDKWVCIDRRSYAHEDDLPMEQSDRLARAFLRELEVRGFEVRKR